MRSARSARAFIGSAPIFLCTDQQAPSDAFDVVFTIQHPTYSFVDKINGLLSFRSQHGIFLDTDTFVCGDLTNIFDLLQQFDIAVAHASWRSPPRVKDGTVVEPSFRNAPIPDSFPDFNTGVIAFRNTPAVNDVFKNCTRSITASVVILSDNQLTISLHLRKPFGIARCVSTSYLLNSIAGQTFQFMLEPMFVYITDDMVVQRTYPTLLILV